jgi:hypothetical protein
MTDIFDELLDKVHANVQYVQARSLFWAEDTEGEICRVVLGFDDATLIELACASPGGIVVRRHLTEKGLPPGLEEELTVLSHVLGPLRGAARSSTAIVLEIGKHKCEIENVGDQLRICVDGEDISVVARSRPPNRNGCGDPTDAGC